VKAKGISTVVATALLIVVAIALVVGLYFASQRFTQVENPVQVQAIKVQSSYSGGKHISVVSLRIVSRLDKPLNFSGLEVIYTQEGTSTIATASVSGTSWGSGSGSGVITSVSGPTSVAPGATVELAVTLTANADDPILKAVFRIHAKDPAGATYSFTSNEVTLAG